MKITIKDKNYNDAVLDPDDMQVATLDDDGDVVWEPLADFEA